MLSPFSFDADELPHDYHAQVTVTWAELEDLGFVDWDEPEWQWDAYDDAQRERLQNKISARYEFREIGIMPPAVWRRQFIRKLNEIMPKYKLLYAKVAAADFNPFAESHEFGGDEAVTYDFPAAMLDSENQDYASMGNSSKHEDVVEGATLDKINAIRRGYDDIDVMILDDLEVMFSSLMTTSINGF